MPDYFETGFMVREPAWHGMGEILDDYPGREAGIILAGHNFEVIEREIYLPTPVALGSELGSLTGEPPEYALVGPDGVFELNKLATHKALVKRILDADPAVMSDLAARYPDFAPLTPGHESDGGLMHVASSTYGTVQNQVGWDIIDALVGEGVKYETAGVLKGGAVCWVLAYLDEPYTVAGDDSAILPYVNVAWSHDGSSAISARPTSIRVVCWNTQSAAEAQGERNHNAFTFRHSSKVMERIEDAKMAMQGIRGAHEEYVALAEDLATIKVTEKQRELFISEFIPMPPEALISDRVKANIEDARTSLRLLFSDGGKSIPEAHRLTGYGLHLGGVEFLDHLRGYRSRDTLFGRQLLRDEPAKAKLTTLIRECATA